MITDIEFNKDIFGLTEHSFNRRVNTEREHADDLVDVFIDIIQGIKNTSEADGWYRFVMFNSSHEMVEKLSYTARLSLIYYLRRHPNILSTLSKKETRKLPTNITPYVYKWVSEEEKTQLGIHSNFFRGVDERLLNYINDSANTKVSPFIDILSVIDFLLASKSHKWIETSTLNLSVRTGVPIENVRAAMSELFRMKLLVVAYTKGEKNKGRFKQFMNVTLSPEDHESALNGNGIEAEKIISDKDLVPEEYHFTVLNYFYSLVNDRLSGFTGQYKPVSSVSSNHNSASENKSFSVPAETEKITPKKERKRRVKKANNIDSENITAENVQKTSSADNVTVPQLSETLSDIKKYMSSFTDIAESIYRNEEKKNETLNTILQMNNQQKQENEELRKQLNSVKKILNRQERDKNYFMKCVQDSLNMMMGQIISETDSFTRIPKHMLDENIIQSHKADVIKIAVQTAYDIQKLFSSSSTNDNSR